MPRRTTGDSAGAELRAWLLAEETELYEHAMQPPPKGIDGRPAAVRNPALESALDLAMGSRMRTLADGLEYRLHRRDLPPGHPARRAGHLGDALTLTESNELLPDDGR